MFFQFYHAYILFNEKHIFTRVFRIILKVSTIAPILGVGYTGKKKISWDSFYLFVLNLNNTLKKKKVISGKKSGFASLKPPKL